MLTRCLPGAGCAREGRTWTCVRSSLHVTADESPLSCGITGRTRTTTCTRLTPEESSVTRIAAVRRPSAHRAV